MGLANTAVVWGGRIAKCVSVEKGYATIAWIDHRDRIVTREVPASACVRFADAMQPRSFWPDTSITIYDGDLEKQDEALALRNRRRVAREHKRKAHA